MKITLWLPLALFFLALTSDSCKKDRKCDSCDILVINTTLQKFAIVEMDDSFVGFLSPMDTLTIRLSDSDAHTVWVSEDQILQPQDVYRQVQCDEDCGPQMVYFDH